MAKSIEFIGSSAYFSECGRFRYMLTRLWDRERPTVGFIMLNPSIANAEQLDPTVRRCVGYAQRWGFGRLFVANLFPFIATDPKELVQAHASGIDVRGGIEGRAVFEILTKQARAVVAAWGAHPLAQALTKSFLSELLPRISTLWCLGITKKGAPVHPLYQRLDLEPTPYYGDRTAVWSAMLPTLLRTSDEISRSRISGDAPGVSHRR